LRLRLRARVGPRPRQPRLSPHITPTHERHVRAARLFASGLPRRFCTRYPCPTAHRTPGTSPHPAPLAAAPSSPIPHAAPQVNHPPSLLAPPRTLAPVPLHPLPRDPPPPLPSAPLPRQTPRPRSQLHISLCLPRAFPAGTPPAYDTGVDFPPSHAVPATSLALLLSSPAAAAPRLGPASPPSRLGVSAQPCTQLARSPARASAPDPPPASLYQVAAIHHESARQPATRPASPPPHPIRHRYKQKFNADHLAGPSISASRPSRARRHHRAERHRGAACHQPVDPAPLPPRLHSRRTMAGQRKAPSHALRLVHRPATTATSG